MAKAILYGVILFTTLKRGASTIRLARISSGTPDAMVAGFPSAPLLAIVFLPHFVVLSLQCQLCIPAASPAFRPSVTNVSVSTNLSRLGVITATAHVPDRESNILFAQCTLDENLVRVNLPRVF